MSEHLGLIHVQSEMNNNEKKYVFGHILYRVQRLSGQSVHALNWNMHLMYVP